VGRIATEPAPLEALIEMPLVIHDNSIPIAGKAQGSQFSRYTLEYGAGANPTTWTALYTGTTPQDTGLYYWKPTTLPDGDYSLRLRAYKTDGAVYEDRHLFTLDRVSIKSPTPFAAVPSADFEIIGSAGPGDLRSYALRVQKLETGASVNANITLTNGGLYPIVNGLLGVWKTQGLAAGHYKLTLDVTLTSGTVFTRSQLVTVDPLARSGFPAEIPDTTSSGSLERGLIVTDVNNDGRAEVVTAADDRVFLFGGDGNVLAGWPQKLNVPGEVGDSVCGTPVVGDIDGDAQKEIVAVSCNRRVFVWSAGGAHKSGWPRQLGGSSAPAVSLADVNGDQRLDVLVSGVETGVDVLTGTGNRLPGWQANVPVLSRVATVANLDGSGGNEVIVTTSQGNEENRLYVLNSNGATRTGWPRVLIGKAGLSGSPVVGDMDDDGDLEIVALGTDSQNPATSMAYIFHHDGRELGKWPTNATSTSPPALADVDGDGSLEVLVSLTRSGVPGEIQVWNRRGVSLQGWPQPAPAPQNMPTLLFHTPIVADIDGDARSEVIVGRSTEFQLSDSGWGYGFPIQVYRHDGVRLSSLARPAFGTWGNLEASPALADLDADGKLELLWMSSLEGGLITYPRVNAWNLNVATNRAQPWVSHRADARSSGVAKSVVPAPVLAAGTGTTRTINGVARFTITSGPRGNTLELSHPSGTTIQYALGSDLLTTNTSNGSIRRITVPANREVKLRIVTSRATSVTIRNIQN
jgi:hypothetical protein